MPDWPMVIDFWHWWILGAILLILEAFAPGFFFLWLGVAAGVVGLVMLAVPGLAWEYQLLVFAVLSVASIVLFRLAFRRHPPTTDQPALNRRGEQYIGRVLTLDRSIENGYGEVYVDDTRWRVRGEDLPAGSRVQVTGAQGNTLVVERVPGD